MIIQCPPMEKSVKASEAQEMMVSVPGLSAGSVCHSQTVVPVCTPPLAELGAVLKWYLDKWPISHYPKTMKISPQMRTSLQVDNRSWSHLIHIYATGSRCLYADGHHFVLISQYCFKMALGTHGDRWHVDNQFCRGPFSTISTLYPGRGHHQFFHSHML